MLIGIKNYLLLPQQLTEFEDSYLARMNRIAMGFFVLHLPIFSLIAYFNDTGAVSALVLTSTVLAGPLVAIKTSKNRRFVSTIMGVAAMFMGGLLVHFGQGPVQIEMHFYFFVLIALLAVFANPMVIVAAAVAATAHHTLLWLALPASVFNYDAPIWVVGVHAAFVILESVAACFIARSFFDNVIGLEKKVAERTAELEDRNRDMRLILDSVKQGFLTLDPNGRISEERSASVEHLLGVIEPDSMIFDVISRYDPNAAEWMDMGLSEVFDGFMPIELTIDQLPARLNTDTRSLSIQYNPITVDGEVAGLAVVLTDITAEIEKEQLEAESKEMIAVIDGVHSDREGFLEFFQEAERLVEALRTETRDDLAQLKRRLHTLKGNSSIFGLNRVAEACHLIEDHLEQHGETPEGALWTKLFGCWSTARGNLRRLVNEDRGELRLTDEQYRHHLSQILSRQTTEALAVDVASWTLEDTDRRLKRIADQSRRLAERLGKGDVQVRVESNHLRTEPEQWSGFWASLIHVVRNAVDHGFETPEQRDAAGKKYPPELTLRTYIQDERFIVSVADDGRGIHWDRIAEIAKKHELPCETSAQLIHALFQDGVSSADEVSRTSGRGVGMAALKEECEKLEGIIAVQSERGRGTEFRFSFPISKMAPKTNSLLKSHGISNAFHEPIRNGR